MTKDVEGAVTIILAGTVAALAVAAAKGAHGSPIRGLLSNPVPRPTRGRPAATGPRLDRAA